MPIAHAVAPLADDRQCEYLAILSRAVAQYFRAYDPHEVEHEKLLRPRYCNRDATIKCEVTQTIAELITLHGSPS